MNISINKYIMLDIMIIYDYNPLFIHYCTLMGNKFRMCNISLILTKRKDDESRINGEWAGNMEN